jgi:hypothetical protein
LLLRDFGKSFILLLQLLYPPFGRNNQFFNKGYQLFHRLPVGLLLLQSLLELRSFQIDGAPHLTDFGKSFVEIQYLIMVIGLLGFQLEDSLSYAF